MPSPSIWRIPYKRNLCFTGREDVLAELHRALQADARVALSHPLGISGLGGIGKTQTALEYAYRYRTEYNVVFWVRADSVTALSSSLIDMAHVLELPERYEQDQDIIIQAVLRWLRNNTRWLLIYDNIDNLSIAEPFLPKAGAGHLLLTTRASALSGLAQRLDIQKMEPEIGALLILRRANLLALKATLDMANPDDQSIARTISQELDGLPLALDQAGAYIKEVPCPLPDYLSRYRTRRRDVLSKGGVSDYYPASVFTTWSLSFEKVMQANPAAAELLDFCAFLAPDAIPEEMLTGGASYLGPQLQPVAANPMRFDQSIATLRAYSLVARDGDNRVLSIHRLVQAVLRDQMGTGASEQWAERAVRVANAAFPLVNYGTWLQAKPYLPHAESCVSLIKEYAFAFPEATHLLHIYGQYFYYTAQYEQAELLYQQALHILEQEQGPEHSHKATTLRAYAQLYWRQGKYKQAEPLFQQALRIFEQEMGPEHFEIANTLHPLARLLGQLGKYKQAESLFQRALHILEQAQEFGPEHHMTARTLHEFARLLVELGEYKKAELFFQRALHIFEQKQGPKHPSTASIQRELARLYRKQGKYEQAEPLFQQVLDIMEQELNPEHIETASTLHQLALLYQKQSKYEQAEPLFQRALCIFEQRLNPEHPEAASILHQLALLYQKQSKYEQAEPFFQRALAIREQQLGHKHPHTQKARKNYAFLLWTMRRDEEARKLS